MFRRGGLLAELAKEEHLSVGWFVFPLVSQDGWKVFGFFCSVTIFVVIVVLLLVGIDLLAPLFLFPEQF